MLPAELSASIRAGATLFAMMGDQSRCKRVRVELKVFSSEDSGGDGKRRAGDLARLARCRLPVPQEDFLRGVGRTVS